MYLFHCKWTVLYHSHRGPLECCPLSYLFFPAKGDLYFRGARDQLSMLLPRVPGFCHNQERSWKCRILLHSSWALGLATLAEAWETLNYACLFLGIDQWFLLVLFREGHHWRIWTAQFFQSSGGHQANFQFSYRIYPGMCYSVCAWKQRTFLTSPYSVFPAEYLNAHVDCASSPTTDSVSYR